MSPLSPPGTHTATHSAARPAPLRVALIGWGAIARRFVELLAERNGQRVTICAVCLPAGAPAGDIPPGAQLVNDPAGLAAARPEIVIEMAGRGAVAQWGEAALTHARAFVAASTSAFTDDALLARLIKTAEDHGSQLVIPPGAVGGIGALVSASALALDEVCHSIVKPPGAWRGTAAETLIDLGALTKATAFFNGSAREAAQQYPQNANVTIITALAGVGLDQTRVIMVADPATTRNQHIIHASGDFGVLDFTIQARPLASNPKSSEMTALGLVRFVENRFRPLVR